MAIFRSKYLTMVAAHLRANHREYVKGVSVARWILTTLAVFLGVIGFSRSLKGAVWPHTLAYRDVVVAIQHWADVWYNTLGLLTLHLPQRLDRPDLNWELQVARLLLPFMAGWLSIHAYLRLTQQRLRFFSLFRLSEHLIVTGPGSRAHSIVRLLKVDDQKKSVVYITEQEKRDELTDLHALGVVIVRGALASDDTYVRAGLDHASAIVVAGDKVLDNIRACETIRGLTLKARSAEVAPLSLIAAVDSPEVAAVLDASFHEARDGRIECRLLDPLDNIAHGVTKRLLPLLGSPNGPPTIIMIGWAGPAPAIYRRLLRNGPPGFKLVLVDRNAELIKASLLSGAPGLAEVSGLDFISCDASAGLLSTPTVVDALRSLRLGAIIVSVDSDEINFRVAVQIRRFARKQRLWTPPIFVRQQGGDVALESLKKLIIAEAIDVSRIYAFGSVDEQYSPGAVLHQIDETMAQAVHADYLANYGNSPGPSTAPWEQLMEIYRSSNRFNAEHIDVKLANVGCCRMPGQKGKFIFSDEEIERLSALEHWRWCVEKWLDGWVYAPKRDNDNLQHSSLLPYEQLDDSEKEKDRKTVRNIPSLLQFANAIVQREAQIRVSEKVASLSAIDEIEAEIGARRSAGFAPVVVANIAKASDLVLTRELQRRGFITRLEVSEPFSVLSNSLSKDELVLAFDDALDVAPPIDGASSQFQRSGSTGAEPAKPSLGMGFPVQ